MDGCRACEENEAADHGEDPYAVAELPTGNVWWNPTQDHRGSTSFVARTCVGELHELPPDERMGHLRDMAAAAHAVHRAFQPRKLNVTRGILPE